METVKSVADRLREFMDYKGMTNSQFADAADIPRPTLSQLLHGRNKSINDQFLRRLNDSFPELDVRWLLFGLGSMLTDANPKTSEPQTRQNPTAPALKSAEQKELIFDEDGSRTPSPEVSNEISRIIGGDNAAKKTTPPTPPTPEAEARGTEKRKRIESIIVLYSDSSFETFTPSVD